MNSEKNREIFRVSFILKLKQGAAGEYKERHANIWPEMRTMLKEAGIFNYTIWLNGDTVFGYYETHDIKSANDYKAKSEVQSRWSEYMADIVDTKDDGRLNIITPECVFLLE